MFKLSLSRKTGKKDFNGVPFGQQYFLMSNLHLKNDLELLSFMLQKEYILAKPARDAAAKAKMEAEGVSVTDVPLHEENEWNIRCSKLPLLPMLPVLQWIYRFLKLDFLSSLFSEILTRHCVLTFLFLFSVVDDSDLAVTEVGSSGQLFP